MKNAFKYLLLGFLIGYLSWGHTLLLTPLSLFVFFAYFFISKRLLFWFLVLGYYMGTSRGLFYGTAIYYDDYIYALLIYISVVLLMSTAWVLLWSQTQKGKIISFLITQILLLSPPISFISWTNPIQVAGLLFPDTGFYGFCLLLLLVIIVVNVKEKKIMMSLFVYMVISLSIYNFYYGKVKKEPSISTPKTHFIPQEKSINYMEMYKQQNRLVSLANRKNNNFILFPENTLGKVTKSHQIIWNNLETNITVLAGGTYASLDRKNMYYNALFEIRHGEIKPIYQQRVPVPISMWRPFSKEGAIATLFKNPIIDYNGKKIAVLICYEQLVPFSYLHSFWYEPQQIFAISNLWWAKDTSILAIQEETLELWSRLFNIPSYMAYNQ